MVAFLNGEAGMRRALQPVPQDTISEQKSAIVPNQKMEEMTVEASLLMWNLASMKFVVSCLCQQVSPYKKVSWMGQNTE